MCDKCKNGLIPHPTIPNCWLDCECKHDEPTPYRPLQPADIDFPVSRDFYRLYASRNHWNDPGPLVEEQYPQEKLVQLKTVINNYSSRQTDTKTKGNESVSKGGVSL